MQMRRVARDSSRAAPGTPNSSAFGPGDYLLKIDGYNWRGQLNPSAGNASAFMTASRHNHTF